MRVYCDHFASPIGPLILAADSHGLRHILFASENHKVIKERENWTYAPSFLVEARTQLLDYLHGKRKIFNLPLAPVGTVFQLKVWQALADIPFGCTWSYRQLAEHIGRPTAARAVGQANGRNPLPIVLPCHRVIGKNGSLTGFSGGLELKIALLKLEGVNLSI